MTLQHSSGPVPSSGERARPKCENTNWNMNIIRTPWSAEATTATPEPLNPIGADTLTPTKRLRAHPIRRAEELLTLGPRPASHVSQCSPYVAFAGHLHMLCWVEGETGPLTRSKP